MFEENNRSLKTVLIISLCFNLFFMGGFVISRNYLLKLKILEGRTHILSKRLHLTPTQTDQSIKLAGQFSHDLKALRSVHQTNWDLLQSQVLSEQIDPQKIKELAEQSSGVFWEYRSLFVNYFTKSLEILSPDQRRQLVMHVRNRNLFIGKMPLLNNIQNN